MYPPPDVGPATPSDSPVNSSSENNPLVALEASPPGIGDTEAAPKPDPVLLDLLTARATAGLATEDEALGEEEWEDEEAGDLAGTETQAPTGVEATTGPVTKVRRRKRPVRSDAAELRLQGRRAMCKRIEDIAPRMGKQIKLRILTAYFDAKRLPIGREDDEMTQFILSEAAKLADRKRVLDTIRTPGTDFCRDDLKAIIFAVLLQEETFSTPERRLDDKVIAFETGSGLRRTCGFSTGRARVSF